MSDRMHHKSVKSELNKACSIGLDLKVIIDRVGYPKSRIRKPGFETIAEIINAQQLSTKAAAAIWGRLKKPCRGEVTPRKILNRSEEKLQQCGLSRQKINYIQGMSKMLVCGELDLDEIQYLPDNKIISELTRIKEMGVWSAEIYAMFALGRADFFPAGDIALQRYKRMRKRPDEKTTRKVSEKWSPHRPAVAVLMWKFYGSTTLGLKKS